MIISHRLKYMFVHLPKTGGTSIRTLLTTRSDLFKVDVAGNWHNITEETYRKFPYITQKLHTHSKLIEGINYLQDEGYNHQEYFKFVFIRNPWDMMVSEYQYCKQIVAKQEHIHKNNLAGVRSKNFKEFLTTRNPYYQNSFLFGDHAFDFVGKFENIEQDMQTICKKILGDNYTHIDLPHLNYTIRSDYKEYYDDETKRMVEEKFAKIIEFGHYNF